MDEYITSLIKLRKKTGSSSEKYLSCFRKASKFVVYGKEFIPFELFQTSKKGEKYLKELINTYGEAKVITKYDKKLSKFYREYALKREINYIADSISYLKVSAPGKKSPQVKDSKESTEYSLSNLEILASYQSQPYYADDAQLRGIGQSFGENLVGPTNDWLESLSIEGFTATPERYWQVAGVFKKRIWGKLQHENHMDKKVFLCVGLDLEKKTIFYGLECLRSGTSKLSTEQIYKFDLFNSGNTILHEAPLGLLKKLNWKDFQKQSQDFITALIPVYHAVVEYIWGDKVSLKGIHNKLIPLSVKKPAPSEQLVSYNKKVNALATDMVIQYEKDYLKYKGKKQLAKKVASKEGLGIVSYHLDGSEKMIKVIASKSESIQGTLITRAEIDNSIVNSDHAYLYIVTDLSTKRKTGRLYINKGRFDKILKTNPERYVITS